MTDIFLKPKKDGSSVDDYHSVNPYPSSWITYQYGSEHVGTGSRRDHRRWGNNFDAQKVKAQVEELS